MNHKEKILITGSTGLVGTYLCGLLDARDYDIYTVSHTLSSPIGIPTGLDFGNPTSITNTLERIKPDIIVNLAAMTDVEQCESKRDEADVINHLAVREIASYLGKNEDCFVIQVSTDYVFDGELGDYRESSSTNPINWYGMTKLLGEQELINCNSSNWCIARTSTPYGINFKKESFPSFVMRNLAEGKEINILVDQLTSPTYAENLAWMLYRTMQMRLQGIIHTAGASKLSRFDQAVQIATMKNLNRELIKPAMSSEMKWKAPRPKKSTLNVDKATNILETKPLRFDDGIREFIKELQGQS